MKNSLREFQQSLGMSIIGTTLAVGLVFVIVFQYLIYSLVKSRSELAQTQFDKAVQQQVSSLALQVATLASSSEFRSYLRAGPLTRKERLVDFLELIAPLRHASIEGIKVNFQQDHGPATELGTIGENQISFDLCYIGDRLNGRYGNCLATISLYLKDSDLFSDAFSNIKIKNVCVGCGAPISSWVFDNELLNLSKISTFTVDFEPYSPDSSHLQAYCLVFACLIISYGFWIWWKIGVAITSSVIIPINDLITSMKSGDPKPFSINNSLTEYVSIQTHHSTASALARMTQMLAHDVRKPFSMLKTGLNLLQSSSNDPNKFKRNLNLLVSEVERAAKSVDGILTDVMEIGSSATELIQEPIAPESLIESTLGEIFRVYPKSKIAVSYDLKHSAMVNVHLKKVNRIFSNIVGNAVQAMNSCGTLWFKTQMDGDYVQFCIGNAGSLIPQESIAKLFEAFFTSGKKGGTGLGLSIAQKVVQAHGGKIWCESLKSAEYPEGKVEFFFTLPILKGAPLVTTAHLPKHSDEITHMLAMIGHSSVSSSESELHKSEGILLKEVFQRAKLLPRPLGLLIVDDESIYRSALAGWIEESTDLARFCSIHHASGSQEAFDTIKSQSIDLMITDIDMGSQSLSGFDLVKELRLNYGFKGLLFVHSNRIVPDDYRRAGDLGADGFLPKPMAKGQLFKMLLQTIISLLPTESTIISSNDLKATNVAFNNLKPDLLTQDISTSPYNLIAIIDDEEIFRNQWPVFLSGFDTVCYSTAEDFVKDWDQICGRLLGVLTDKYLGPGMDGIKLGEMLRHKAPDLAIILSTSDMSNKDASNIFDLIVDKDAFAEAPKVMECLQSKSNNEDLPALMGKTIRSFDTHARAIDALLGDNHHQTGDMTSIIDLHILSWEFILKGIDQSIKIKLMQSMAITPKEKLKHDIRGSMTRLKILLRNYQDGDISTPKTLESLGSRVMDLAKIKKGLDVNLGPKT